MKSKVEIISNLSFLPSRKELELIANTDGLFAKWNMLKREIDAWKSQASVRSMHISRGRGPLHKVVKEKLQQLNAGMYFVSHVKAHYHSGEQVEVFFSQVE